LETKHVVFCIPIWMQPYRATLDALEACLPMVEAAGYTHGIAQILNFPYISGARANMLRAALDAKADMVVFIDHDVSWRPEDMVTLLNTPGDVVAGTYRCKVDEEQYMGVLETQDNIPLGREDGALLSRLVPAGFLKITKEAVDHFMGAYPELCYGPRYHQSVDLFNHGVHERVWWGEDYSFSRRWRECGGQIWTVPNLNIDHHTKEKVFKGNLHEFLMRQPGGVNDPNK
jgi:hypothetical protein